MCQPLPIFDGSTKYKILLYIALDSAIGYILEVDPQHLHDGHWSIVRCARNLANVMTSSSQHYATSSVTSICNSVLITVFIWPYNSRNLYGEYIEFNTKFRTLMKNDFEKNLYKLMNNAIFDKIMKNVRDRINVRLFTKWEDTVGRQWSPNQLPIVEASSRRIWSRLNCVSLRWSLTNRYMWICSHTCPRSHI